MDSITLRPLCGRYPKARPFAMTLIKAAAEQGVSAEELSVACELATRAYEEARDNSKVSLAEFESKAVAALESL